MSIPIKERMSLEKRENIPGNNKRSGKILKMKINQKKKIILTLLLIAICMGVIFFFSSQPVVQSSAVSQTLTQKIVDVINKIFKNNPPKVLTQHIFSSDHFIRKAGHVLEYFILGALVFTCLRLTNLRYPANATIFICLAYAASDELHQIFVPGRGPLISDVILDTISAGVGVILVIYIRSIKNKRVLKRNAT